MTPDTTVTTALIKSLLERCRGFLEEELRCPVRVAALKLDELQRVELRAMTSIMSLGGGINMIVAFSFDRSLLQRLMLRFSEGIEIEPGEEELYLEDTACEIINIVAGNSTADIQMKGETIPLSPPLMISGGKSIARHRNAQFFEADMATDHGQIKAICIGPRDLFDPDLNYVE